jgi:thioredoxin-like negative regulator of GroEL
MPRICGPLAGHKESVNVKEVTAAEIEQKLAMEPKPFAVFFYSPLCGTCKLAERMLAVVEETIPDVPLFRANINGMPEWAKRWRVSSVPALFLFSHGQVAARHYALRSVDFLYQLLKPLR